MDSGQERRRGIPFHGPDFLWEGREGWKRLENILNLPVQLELPCSGALASPEESPLQSPILNSCPKVWPVSLMADGGVSNSSIYEVQLMIGSHKLPNS